ncbi:MAG: hypothetical protein KKE23_03155 [Nanoarchaeota archaeon]|nr:hypothetical protein [Nanoarchaeota archaeon]
MEYDYSRFLPKDVVEIITHVDTISAKKHNGNYAPFRREFERDYAEKKEFIESILDRVSLSYNLIAKPIAIKCNEKDLENIKITNLRYVSVSSEEMGLIDGVFIDYEHFDGWKINKSTIPMKGLEIKLEERENDGFKSIVWTPDRTIEENKNNKLRLRVWTKKQEGGK